MPTHVSTHSGDSAFMAVSLSLYIMGFSVCVVCVLIDFASHRVTVLSFYGRPME